MVVQRKKSPPSSVGTTVINPRTAEPPDFSTIRRRGGLNPMRPLRLLAVLTRDGKLQINAFCINSEERNFQNFPNSSFPRNGNVVGLFLIY